MRQKGGKMEPLYISIKQQETGQRIHSLMNQKGYTVKDIQNLMGFENPQAVYKWLSGRSLPSLDNLLILSRALNMHMDDLLVIDGEIVLSGYFLRRRGCGPLFRLRPLKPDRFSVKDTDPC